MTDVGPGLALIGSAASVTVWAIAIWSAGRATAAAIAAAPPSWHRRFGDLYEVAVTLRLRDFLLAPSSLRALAFWMAAFLILDVFDVTLVLQAGAAVAYAVWATVSDRTQRREEIASLGHDGLEPVATNHMLSWWYDGSMLTAWVGFLGAACFLALLIVELAGG